jgi:2-methylisocitrate lyase-like PEP mutase family enzyme
MSQADRGASFASLHVGEPFLIPNPWDAGSARTLEALGFPALTTTSSGFAFTLGRLDGGATLDELAGHVSTIASAVGVPVAVDLEDGHGPRPEEAADAVRLVAACGAVGASIEDWDPRRGRLYERERAAERIAAAAEAARGLGFPFVLVGRAENHIRGNPDLADTIARLQSYETAGADCLYAPGLRSLGEIRAVCSSVSKPVNVLAVPELSATEIFAAGAQRISVGGALTWVAAAAFLSAAERVRAGDLSVLAARIPLDELFRPAPPKT